MQHINPTRPCELEILNSCLNIQRIPPSYLVFLFIPAWSWNRVLNGRQSVIVDFELQSKSRQKWPLESFTGGGPYEMTIYANSPCIQPTGKKRGRAKKKIIIRTRSISNNRGNYYEWGNPDSPSPVRRYTLPLSPNTACRAIPSYLSGYLSRITHPIYFTPTAANGRILAH